MREPILLIDGDVSAYLACPPRWEAKATVVDEVSYVSLDDDGNKVIPDYTEEEDTRYLMMSYDNFKKQITEIRESLFITEENCLVAVAGKENYRKTMYDQYKMNRHKDPKKQNKFVPILRELAVAEDIAIAAHGREADDLIRIWYSQAWANNREPIVCSIDKDLKCMPGKHYNPKKKELTEVKPHEAMWFYYSQLLQGDSTDNIPGLPGIGPVYAKRMLEHCTTEKEFQETVAGYYIAEFGDEWKDYLLSNGKMIHIQTRVDDYFSISNWSL